MTDEELTKIHNEERRKQEEKLFQIVWYQDNTFGGDTTTIYASIKWVSYPNNIVMIILKSRFFHMNNFYTFR